MGWKESSLYKGNSQEREGKYKSTTLQPSGTDFNNLRKYAIAVTLQQPDVSPKPTKGQDLFNK